MARGKKKHLKRLRAPKHWLLSKLDGIYATRPRAGPHKLRECIPLSIFLRHHLRYALIENEVIKIINSRHILVNGVVVTDRKFPLGLMDIVSIPRTGENFRMILDNKGRYYARPIDEKESEWTVIRIVKKFTAMFGRVNCVAHNGWTLSYPHPDIMINDSVKVLIKDKQNPEKQEVIKFKVGAEALCTGGRNKGRIGIISHRTKIPAQQDIVRLTDTTGSVFSTQLRNLFVIGDGKSKAFVGYDGRNNGLRKTIMEERVERMKNARRL